MGKPARLHYGWIVVMVAFVAMLVAAGIRSTPGVLMIPLEEEFKWDRATISLGVAINLVLYGFSGPFVSALMERYGVRRMMVMAMIMILAGTGLTIWMFSAWQFHLLWGVVVGLGSGFFLTVLGAIVASHWFVKNRGLVLGLLTASAATGQLAFLPLLAYMIESYNWRTAIWILVGAAMLAVLVIAFLMRDTPEQMGLRPFGATLSDHAEQQPKRNPIAAAFRGLKLGVRSFDFWFLAGSFFICGLSTSGLIGTHLIPASVHHGIPEVTAAGLLAMMGIFDIAGTMISGWLSDRWNNRWLLFWYYGLRGLSLMFLPSALGSNHLSLIVFAVFYGLDWVATVPPTVRLTADVFGKQNAGIVYGWIFAAHQLGAGVAAFGGGLMFTLFKEYDLTFILAGLFCLAASMMVLQINRKRRKQEEAAVTAYNT
ncbi:MFS transporter [Effusibacillus lacus]|nr:MFS transporter [Effusibacillus lacus]TCS74784.1 sugar phosphate permease [Effusibacillus lacus]